MFPNTVTIELYNNFINNEITLGLFYEQFCILLKYFKEHRILKQILAE